MIFVCTLAQFLAVHTIYYYNIYIDEILSKNIYLHAQFDATRTLPNQSMQISLKLSMNINQAHCQETYVLYSTHLLYIE